MSPARVGAWQWARGAGVICAWACGADAQAHAFAAPYMLPVPFWMYAYGAVAALLVSFVIVGVFASAPGDDAKSVPGRDSGKAGGTRRVIWRPVPAGLVRLLRVSAAVLLVLSSLSGFLGVANPFLNINMTLFWIVFVLGLTYATALLGDVFSFANPWLTICDGLQGAGLVSLRGRLAYPPGLGCYPALLFYVVFIWIELFGHTSPLSLSVVLTLYTVLTVFLAWLFGKAAWFRHGELFAVFFRLVGLLAPLAYRPGQGGGVMFRLRMPLSGLLQRRRVDGSVLLFILFMLASTAFDGAHETRPWSKLFWEGLYPWLEPMVTAASRQPYAIAARLYYLWQWLMLVLSPLVYLGVYVAFIWLSKVVARSRPTTRALCGVFGLALIPIAFVYHVSHYYTLLLAQGPQLIKLLSDPLGLGWDVFGTARMDLPILLVDANFIWHSQVALILAGHIASVFLAHGEALRCHATRRGAVLSQIPMLLLMVALTALGLWILSLPLGTG